MKKILVTGTGGRIGALVASDLLDAGFAVRGLDIAPLSQHLRGHERRANLETVYADLSDKLAILQAAEGCEAIAHLAAVPSPIHDETRLLTSNVIGTANILQAAEAHGIGRVALASSCCAFGLFFARNDLRPQYFPMDEAHPTVNEDMYGLSKRVNELTAEAFSRRSGLTTVTLRLTTVVHHHGGHHRRWLKHQLASGGQRAAKDLWSYVDERDASRAFCLALSADITGHHVLVIAARNSFTRHDIRDLARLHYPEVPLDQSRVAPDGSLYDTSLAEATIGWKAEFDWRDDSELAAVEPEPLEK